MEECVGVEDGVTVGVREPAALGTAEGDPEVASGQVITKFPSRLCRTLDVASDAVPVKISGRFGVSSMVMVTGSIEPAVR